MSAQSGDGTSREYVAGFDADRRWGQFMGLVTAVIIIALIWWLLMHISRVPPVVGMSAPQAKTTINTARFPAQFLNLPKNARLAGKVVLQVPSKGLRFTWMPVRLVVDAAAGARGRAVSLADDKPSAMPPMADSERYRDVMPYDPEEMYPLYRPQSPRGSRMPNVQNTDVADAVSLLERRGMAVRVRTGPSTVDIAKGLVFYQDPAPGSKVKRRQDVLLWVSNGALNILPPKNDRSPYPRPGH